MIIDDAGRPPRGFFVHLQKTGGTALFQRLRDAVGPSAVYPTPVEQGDVRAVTDVDFLTDRYRAHHDELRVVTGHFPLCATELLGDQFTTFTVLREPVERVLSLLRRRSKAEARFDGWALERIYDEGGLEDIIINHMVKMLSLTVDEMTSAPLVAPIQFDEDRLATARRNLELRLDLFGLQEHFDDFCTDLADRFGWDLGRPRFANRTEPAPVSGQLRSRIASDNRLDAELYEFASRLWHDRRPATTGS